MPKQYRILPLIAFIMLILCSFPLISAANKQQMLGGIPVLFVYIFIIWLLAIIAACLIFKKR